MCSRPDPDSALATTRLAIIDLARGHAADDLRGRSLILTYNGEIYNHAELRAELVRSAVAAAAIPMLKSSSTPSMHGAWAASTTERHVRLRGLRPEDPPLEPGARPARHQAAARYGRTGAFAFASELKALRAIPGWRGELNQDALASYLRLTYVPSPHSIYRGIDKLAPGYIATIDAGGTIETRAYRRFSPMLRATDAPRPLELGDEEATDGLEALLRDAVRGRMIADVSLGAMLSGGINSTTVVALMQAMSSRPVKTFCIGFHEPKYNEATHAAAIARHLGTDHTELYVTPEDSLDLIPRLPEMYDEPFADPSQIPTFIVSRLARTQVTVALSGDGGDELFAGYTRHRSARSSAGVPASVGKGIACGLRLRRFPHCGTGCLVCFRRGAARLWPATRCSRP